MNESKRLKLYAEAGYFQVSQPIANIQSQRSAMRVGAFPRL